MTSRSVAVAAVAATLFLSAMSQTVVSPALPRIVGELGGMQLYGWVLTSSMLASTVSIALTGKLTDRYGRKPFLLGGTAMFLAASAMTGASQSMEQLLAFRAVQGFAGGIVTASAFAAIGDLYPASERGRSMGLFTGVFGLASIAGPLLGGFVTDHVGWRWLFYANLPLGVAVLGILWRGFPRGELERTRLPLDVAGMAALLAAILPILFAISLAGDRFAWGSYQTAVLVTAGVGGACALVLIERRAADPMVPLAAFRNRTFVVVSIATFLTGVGLFGALAYMPLFIQGVLGLSATHSGLVNTPLMVALTLASVIAGNLAARTLRYRNMVLVGGAIVSGGMLLMVTLSEESAVATAFAGMAIIGFGLGVTMPLMALATQNALPQALLGVASSSTQFFRQIGGTLGMAIGGTIITSRIQSDLAGQLPREVTEHAPPEMLRQLETPGLLLSPSGMETMRAAFDGMGPGGAALYADTVAAMRTVLAGSLHEVFIGGLIVAACALIVSTLMPNALLQSHEVESEIDPSVPVPTGLKLTGAPTRTIARLRSTVLRTAHHDRDDDVDAPATIARDHSAPE